MFFIIKIPSLHLPGLPTPLRLQYGCAGPATEAMAGLAFLGLTGVMTTSAEPIVRTEEEAAAAAKVAAILHEAMTGRVR
jgi:hypothetical protein